MNDEFFNIEVGETFLHQGSGYRKLDQNRAMLVCDAKTANQKKGKAYFFYPEDEVQRNTKQSMVQANMNGFGARKAGDTDVST
tara:strand:+ start:24119 stop:24367 length:249 start_codon:yes stop_codon:yes gene_type:complete